MANIPYTLQSLRVLAERESRRGKDISRIIPSVDTAVSALRERREKYKLEVSTLTKGSTAYDEARAKYFEERSDLRALRDDALEESLEQALRNFEVAVSDNSFVFELKPAVKLGDRQTYSIASDLSIAFPSKQAANVVRNLKFTGSYSRNSITRALKESLEKKYAHAIYRLDIKKFFDSIPHEGLLFKLRVEPRFDRITEALVAKLLTEYSEITGSPKGVPQGVGISSHLAEFYMGGFDRQMKTTRGVLFYARYVDDIVLVMDTEATLSAVKQTVSESLEALQLMINDEKTAEIIADKEGNYASGESLNYLGYCFTRANGSLTTSLTEKRHARRVSRLQKSFQHWLDGSPGKNNPNTGRDGLLHDRIRYLAGNTKLLNSKANVAVGLYFSNSALDEDAQDLNELDTLLAEFLAEHVDKLSPLLYAKLSCINFVDSFRDKPFYRFSQQRLKRIVQLWQEETV